MDEAQVRQVPVALLELEAVPDEELVGDREAHVANGKVVDEPPVGPVEERCDVERRRAAQRHRLDEVVHRHPGVDHGVDEHHVAALDLRVEIFQEADAVLVDPVPRQLDEVEVVMDRDRAREVADERDAGFERADEQWLAVRVVAAQLGAQLPDTRADLVSIEEDLADALVELDQRAQEAFRNP